MQPAPADSAATVDHPPRIFISYRRADCVDEAASLSERLRNDLAGDVVFRDGDPFAVLPGEDWRHRVEDALAAADASVLLIGEAWPGYVDGDGQPIDEPRITDPTDMVRREIELTLGQDDPPVAIPVFVGLDVQTKARVMADSDGLLQRLEDDDIQRLDVDRGVLARDDSVEYQQVLVGAWVALRRRHPHSILVVGDEDALLDLDNLVDELISSRRVDRTALSRFAGGAYVLRSARSRWRGHRLRKKAPDVIVAINAEDPSDQMVARLRAVVTNPHVKRVTLVAVGSASAATAATLATQAAGWGSTCGTSVVASETAAAAVPSTTAIGGLTVGGKVAAAAVAVGGASAATAAAVAIIPDPEVVAIELEDSELRPSTADEEAYPFGAPPSIAVELSEPVVPAELTSRYPDGAEPVQRDVVVELYGERLELGPIDHPTNWGPFADANGPGEYTLAEASTSATLPVTGVGTYGWCYEIADPTNIVAGWQFDQDAVEIDVRFLVIIGDDGVEDTSAIVRLTAPATRVPIDEDWVFDDGTRCEERRDGDGLFWSAF